MTAREKLERWRICEPDHRRTPEGAFIVRIGHCANTVQLCSRSLGGAAPSSVSGPRRLRAVPFFDSPSSGRTHGMIRKRRAQQRQSARLQSGAMGHEQLFVHREMIMLV